MNISPVLRQFLCRLQRIGDPAHALHAFRYRPEQRLPLSVSGPSPYLPYLSQNAAPTITATSTTTIIIFSWMHMPCFSLHPSIEHISDISISFIRVSLVNWYR
jgi:hypothetical protein